ncbi:hypothetical protein C8R46DRAFT_1061382 [Mycena filopes]|nr:hypothetical protein C8R46DRAFT_1061382 [Mycena filopes]
MPVNLFRNRSPETPKSAPPSPPTKRASEILFRSQSGSDLTASPSNGKAPATAPPPAPPLGIANVANIFIKMRRAQAKPSHIESSSGEHPQSHPDVLAAVADPERAPLRLTDTFICDGAVNVVQLLRATRNALLDLAAGLDGANALVDEQWSCTIHGPKHKPNRTFKVQISYTASAARSSCADPHRPIAVDKAKGVPGLMTVIKRITE